jgi:hypothetical protein
MFTTILNIFFCVVKGPTADATDALQPRGLLCGPVKMKMIIFCSFPSNGAPVEWNWQGKTEERAGKTCPSATLSTTNPTSTDPGSNTGIRGGTYTRTFRAAANSISFTRNEKRLTNSCIFLMDLNPLTSYSMDERKSFPGNKAVGAWKSTCCQY